MSRTRRSPALANPPTTRRANPPQRSVFLHRILSNSSAQRENAPHQPQNVNAELLVSAILLCSNSIQPSVFMLIMLELAVFNCSAIAPGIPAPNPTDCSVLIDSFGVISQLDGPTFFVETFTVMQLSFQTCVLTFTPLDTRAGILMEYCWDELVRIF